MESVLLILSLLFSSPSQEDLKAIEEKKVNPPLQVNNSNLDSVLGFIR